MVSSHGLVTAPEIPFWFLQRVSGSLILFCGQWHYKSGGVDIKGPPKLFGPICTVWLNQGCDGHIANGVPPIFGAPGGVGSKPIFFLSHDQESGGEAILRTDAREQVRPHYHRKGEKVATLHGSGEFHEEHGKFLEGLL